MEKYLNGHPLSESVEGLDEPYYLLPLAKEPERYPVGSERLVLIPIFSCRFYGTHEHNPKAWNKLAAYARHALHARRTWMEHTDAREYGVAVKFYVDATVMGRVAPVLEAGGVDVEADVILFWDARGPEDWARLSKETRMLWDLRFRDYEWVVVGDADLFVSLGHLNFFERLEQERLELGFLTLYHETGASLCEHGPVRDRVILTHGMEYARINSCVHATGREFRDAKDLLERIGLERWRVTEEQALLIPALALMVFPAKSYHADRQFFLEWLRFYAPELGTGEACLEIWHQLYGHESGWWDVRQDWNVQFQDPWEQLWREGNFLHGRPVNGGQAELLLQRVGHAAA